VPLYSPYRNPKNWRQVSYMTAYITSVRLHGEYVSLKRIYWICDVLSNTSAHESFMDLFFFFKLTSVGVLRVFTIPPDHLLLDSAPNLGPLISRWEINKFENCWYKSVKVLDVLKLLFEQFLNLLISQLDTSGPMLGDLSNNRWSEGTLLTFVKTNANQESRPPEHY
jgi:hypothetical protein